MKRIFSVIKAWVIQAFYYIRVHTYNRYHIVNLKLRNHRVCDWGWIDADHKILIACFNIFEDFMTNEYPGMIDWDYESVDPDNYEPEDLARIKKEHQERHALMKQLLNWWTTERKQRHNFADELLVHAYKDYFEIQDSGKIDTDEFADLRLLRDIAGIYMQFIEEQDNEMLIKLISVRESLWT